MPDSRADTAALPLRGVRVLSLAEQYPGPFATMILADLGADVVLVERPAGGDPTRRFPGHFAALNRNKRSVALDLKSEGGREAVQHLLRTADVFVEGFRPGVVEKLGLGAAELREAHPELVYCSISGFGQTGPRSPRAGHDLSMQATAGYVVPPLDDPQGLPAPAPLPLADLSSAMFAAVGVLAALVGKASTHAGRTVDVSMVESLLAWRSVSLVSSLNDLAPSPYPPDDPGYGVFATAGGDLMALSIAGEDHQWRALCEELQLTDLADLSTAAREERRVEVEARLRAAMAATRCSDLAPTLEARGVGFSLVNDDEMVAGDEQVRARGMLIEVGDGSGLVVTRQPVVFDGTPGGVDRGVPRLGEHTVPLLAESGLSPHRITELVREGAAHDGSAGVPRD